MKIRILTQGGDKTFEVSGDPVILETNVGTKKHIFHVNANGSLSKVRNKKHLAVVGMLEKRQVNYTN